MKEGYNIGLEIKKFREAKKLNRTKFAEIYGLEVSNLYKWEKGTKPSDPEDYKKLENILKGADIEVKNADLNNLIGRIEERLIRVESYSTVLMETSVNLVSQATGKQSALVSAELSEAVSMVTKRRLDELRRKKGL